jgi:hypothetical protein
MKRYHLLCQHEVKRNRVPYETTVDDYHPLTKPQLKRLLLIAQREPLAREEVRIRLHQGMPGYTCPRPLHGDLAQKLRQISSFLDEACAGGPMYTPVPLTDAVIKRCFALMQAEPT